MTIGAYAKAKANKRVKGRIKMDLKKHLACGAVHVHTCTQHYHKLHALAGPTYHSIRPVLVKGTVHSGSHEHSHERKVGHMKPFGLRTWCEYQGFRVVRQARVTNKFTCSKATYQVYN